MSLGRLGRTAARLLFVACALATCAAAGPAPSPGDVFARASAARASGRPALVIFGLDRTIVDPAARTREIFVQAFDGPDPVVTPSRPDLATAIRALPLSDYEYAPEATLAKIGVTDSAFVRAVVTRWNQDFNANRFLSRDEPVPGAVSYVDSLYARGCTIVYLSGRDARRMLAGTAQNLFERGFPVGVTRTMLALDPGRATPGSRQRALDDLAASGTVVAVFESDPAALNQLHARFPEALAFHVDAKHAADAPAVAPGIGSLADFTGIKIP